MRLGTPLIAGEGPCVINAKDRFRHLYVLGASQTGKTTFFLNLIKQETDYAIIVLDPAGSFAPQVASLSSPDRLIYIDKDHPLIINPLRRKQSRSEIANTLIEVVNNCITGTTPSLEITVLMAELIRNAIRVLKDKDLELDYLSDFLNHEQIRNKYRDDSYWQHFDDKDKKGWYVFREKRESAQRVAARLSAFFLDEDLKRFTIGANQLNIKKIVENKKIVCFNFKGLDSDLMIYLGNLITTAVKSYYMHEATIESNPLFFYIDEWHLFMSPAFTNILAECAKFNISVNVSHHAFEQVNKKILDVALGNCYSKVVFNCGYEEAERLAKEFQLKPGDFLNLKKYQALVKIGNKIFHIRTFPPPDIQPYQPKPPVNFLRHAWIKPEMV